MNLSLPAFGLFLWMSALTIIAGWPLVQPPAWNAQRALCDDALERRRMALQGMLLPDMDGGKASYYMAQERLPVLEGELKAAQTDVRTYCR